MTDRRRRRSGSNTSQGESSPAVFVNIDPSSRQDTQPSGRNLLFVDANASPARAREATRVHVMREHHRARRLAMEDPASSSERIEGSSQSRRAAVQPIVTSEAEGSRPGDTLGDLNDPLGPGGSDLMGEYPVRPSPVVNSLVHHCTQDLFPFSALLLARI